MRVKPVFQSLSLIQSIAPEDELLYAVILHLNTNSADSGDTADTKPMTITDAVLTITRDEPTNARSKSPFPEPNQALEAEKDTLNHP